MSGATGRLALPGDVIGQLADFVPGPGAYADPEANVVRASRTGRVETIDLGALEAELADEAADESPSSSSAAAGTGDAADAPPGKALPMLMVVPRASASTPAVPAEGDVVMGRVRSVGERQAEVTVLVLGEPGRALRSALRGTVRREDVRATDVDRVVMLRSMRPGDVIRAKVLSLGDRRSLFMATAEPELGVVWARGRSGHVLVPASHDTMRCPATGEDEARKVARYGF